jgi:hypothetical protein
VWYRIDTIIPAYSKIEKDDARSKIISLEINEKAVLTGQPFLMCNIYFIKEK